MAYAERVLALDIGASSIKAAEFEYSARGEITLVNFGQKEYTEELNDANRTAVLSGLIRDLLQEKGFASRKALVSLSGQSAFIRFVKLPPVSDEERRVRQIVEFEARQNVPFPMEEVIWDYQLIASSGSDEMDVMFVVIKNESVEQVTRAVQSLGLDPVLVDIAPVACYNAARANRVGDDECVMILNIGARSSNLLFVDRSRFFARTIPIAGHTITQQIAKEFNISLEEAEEMKRHHGFVGLGGAYEITESEVATTISKIIRNVMTRLHGEINRSISVYRAQQKGNRPVRMYLSGGSSTMAYTDRFFREACDMEVSYLNPFQVVSMGPGLDLKHLEGMAHVFSEVVGLGLRHRVQCPVEISLLPDAIRRAQTFRKKKPYLLGSAAALVGLALLGVVAEGNRSSRYKVELDKNTASVERMEREKAGIETEQARLKAVRGQYDQIVRLLAQRNQLPAALNELQGLKPANVWITGIRPLYEELKPAKDVSAAATPIVSPSPGSGMPAIFGGPAVPAPPASAAASAQAGKIYGFEIRGHSVTVKGDKKVSAVPVQDYFDSLQRSASGLFEQCDRTGIVQFQQNRNLETFAIQLKLKKPIEFPR